MNKVEKNALKILKIFKKAGFEAFFAGGYVRDKILGRSIHDIDIATSANLKQIEEILSKNNIKVIHLGDKFGVLGALIDEIVFEVATFRTEFGTIDFRHPKKVKFGVSPKEDVQRRDFTINGMLATCYLTSVRQAQKEGAAVFKINKFWAIDWVGGLRDLEKKLIRFIGKAKDRIKEDALRMLRAVRFACQLDFEIEKEGKKAIKENANLILKLSSERQREELTKILLSHRADKGFLLLDELGLLNLLLPEITELKKIPQPKIFHAEGNAFIHTIKILKALPKNSSLELAWAALLHDIGKSKTMLTPEKHGVDRIRFSGHDVVGAKMAEKICRRFKMSNEQTEKITWLVRNHMIFFNFLNMRIARQRRLMHHPYFSDLLELYRLDIIASVPSYKGKILPPNFKTYNKIKKIYEEELARPPEPERLLSGYEIMDILNISPGPLVGEILEKLKDAQLEGEVKTKKQAIEFVKKFKK